MWGLLTAAVVGIFSSIFNIGSSASMIHTDNAPSPKYREEYQYSHFDEGFQTNDESGTIKTARDTSDSSQEPFSVRGVYIPSMPDISARGAQENANDGHDSVTVLSGS